MRRGHTGELIPQCAMTVEEILSKWNEAKLTLVEMMNLPEGTFDIALTRRGAEYGLFVIIYTIINAKTLKSIPKKIGVFEVDLTVDSRS